jgi:hypothetical protein
VVDPRLERVEAGLAAPSIPPARALVSFAATYTTLTFLAALAASSSAVRPIPGQAVLGGGIVATIGICLGTATYVRGGLRRGLGLIADVVMVPARARGWLAGAAAAVAVQLLVGAALLVAGMVRGREAAAAVQDALSPGRVGEAAMAVLQLAYLPDGVVWGAAFATGPGFAIGEGTFVTPAASSLGSLPALPLLAAVPPTGPRPGWMLAVLAAGFVAGVIGLLVVRRRHEVPARSGGRIAAGFLDALGLAAVSAVLMLLTTWTAAGPAGPGRLRVAGPDPLVTAGVFAAEVAVGALVTTMLLVGWDSLRGRRVGLDTPVGADAAGEQDAVGTAARRPGRN